MMDWLNSSPSHGSVNVHAVPPSPVRLNHAIKLLQVAAKSGDQLSTQEVVRSRHLFSSDIQIADLFMAYTEDLCILYIKDAIKMKFGDN